jgi:hypothetical protein
MSTIKNKLTDLARHLNINRQVGHTTAVIHGAKNIESNVIVHNRDMVSYLSRENGPKNPQHPEGLVKLRKKKRGEVVNCISLGELEKLYGDHRPIVFDNCALYVLFSNSLSEIRRLESKIEKIRQVASCD